MTESIESLAQQLVHRVTDPFGLAILTGMVSSSFYFFAGLGMALDGILPATINESERAKRGVSNASALKLWQWMFTRAKTRFITASLISTTSFGVASTFRPDLRPLLYGASFLAFSVAPFTILMLLPINNQILKIADDVSKSDAKSPESGVIDKLFGDWNKYNTVRMSIGAMVWVLGATTLLLA